MSKKLGIERLVVIKLDDLYNIAKCLNPIGEMMENKVRECAGNCDGSDEDTLLAYEDLSLVNDAKNIILDALITVIWRKTIA